MMLRVRLRVVVLLLALVLPVGLVAGCGGDDSDGAPKGSSQDSPAKALPDLPSQADLTAYFTAVAAYDVDALAAAEKIAADGSPAQLYATYLGEYAGSAIASGQPVDPAEVEQVDDTFKACGGTGTPTDCAVWADLEGDDGRLTDFTVDGVDIADSLVDLSDQAPVSSPGVYEVQPDVAYRSPQSGTLFVLVTIAATDTALAPKPGLYIEDDQILHGVETRAPASIAPGSSSPVILAFPKAEAAELNGQVTFELGIAGAGAESIGFGLTEPAPA
jgi:hypothetical protein